MIARPPRLFMGFLAAGIVLGYLWPVSALHRTGPDVARYALGALLGAAGALLMTAAVRQFRQAGTHVETYRPAVVLVTHGIFARSRNPMYVALTLLYAGIGVLLDSAWSLGLLIPLLVLMRFGVIAREERYLARRFEGRYLAYRASVRRWL